MKSLNHYIVKAIHNPEKVFGKIDKIFFGGCFRKMANARENTKQRKLEQYISAHPEAYYDKQVEQRLRKCQILGQNEYAVRDVLYAQFQNGEAVFYDVVVCLLAIEQYYGKSKTGYDLYARLRSKQAGYGAFWLDRFIKLIQSYEKDHAINQPLELDENLILIDGAGRLALALYNGDEFIKGNVHNSNYSRVWNYNLLWELNFSKEEVSQIHQRAIKLFKDCLYQYVGVIWPAAYHLRDEIIADVNACMTNGVYAPLQVAECKVLNYVDLSFKKIDFEGFVRAMYRADNMSEEGLAWKNQIIYDCMPDNCEDYPVRIVYFDVNRPEMIRNDGNHSARSQQITKLKRVIRSRFKDKVAHYAYDNIMHISDNYQQSKFCDMAVHFDRNLSSLFEILNSQFEYAIVKIDGRQCADFPKSIYFYTDVDLLVQPTDMRGVGDVVERWLKTKYGNISDWVEVERIADDDEQIMVRVAIRGWMCFMVHIQTVAHFRMNAEFVKECLAKRQISENMQVYVVAPSFEILFRAAELVKNPKKKWHRWYIEEHMDAYDAQLTNNAFGYNLNLLENVQSIIASIGK